MACSIFPITETCRLSALRDYQSHIDYARQNHFFS